MRGPLTSAYLTGALNSGRWPIDTGPHQQGAGSLFGPSDCVGRKHRGDVLYGAQCADSAQAPADAPARCIYVEDDRGVIYQHQLAVWEYLAGTMWGTFSPDQRPTDLGVHDAGFTFRTTDEPPREFIWSQTAWVEIEITQMVFYGTHAGRPAPAGRAGWLHLRRGRASGVIYQNQLGVWGISRRHDVGDYFAGSPPDRVGRPRGGFHFPHDGRATAGVHLEPDRVG